MKYGCMFFDKKKNRIRISTNEQLAEELRKTTIKKFKRRKVYARFKDITCAGDLAEMKSLSSKNENAKYLLYVIGVLSE